LTSGQTYKYDQLGQLQLADLPTRQPNASCFNFFAPAQNILKFFDSRTNGTFASRTSRHTTQACKRAVFATVVYNQFKQIHNFQKIFFF